MKTDDRCGGRVDRESRTGGESGSCRWIPFPRRFFQALLIAAALWTSLSAQDENPTGTPETPGEVSEPAREPDSEPGNRIVITATALDPDSLPAQATVLGEDEIRAAAPRNAAETVAPLVGIGVSRLGGIMQPSFISIRGSSPEQVLVLVNGKRLNTAQGGGVDLSTIPADAIERIEVVRGGGSALYGEGAVGGVINIVTKDGYGKETGGGISYSFSSFNTHVLTGEVSGSFGKDDAFDAFVAGTGIFSGGEFTYPDPEGEDGDIGRVNAGGTSGGLNAKLGWDVSGVAGLRLGFAGQAYADEKGVPGTVEFPTDDAVMSNRRFNGLFSLEWSEAPFASLAAELSGSLQRRKYVSPSAYPDGTDDTHENATWGIDLSAGRDDGLGIFRFRTTARYNYRFDHLVSTALAVPGSSVSRDGEMYRTAHGISLTSEIAAVREQDERIFSLFPAVRLDALTLYPGEGLSAETSTVPSWNLGLLLPVVGTDMLLLRGTIGSSYRLPSFDDLFWPATAFAEGNPDLLPEHAFSWDAGVEFLPLPFLSLSAAYFRNDVENLIQWNPGAEGLWRPVNIGRALLSGAELETKLLLELGPVNSLLELRANYTYLSAKDMTPDSTTYGLYLPRRPREQANIAATLTHRDGHFLRAEGRYTGFRFVTAKNTKFLPSVFVLDVSGEWRISEHMALGVNGRNLLAAEYVDIRDFPIPGRELGAEIRLEF